MNVRGVKGGGKVAAALAKRAPKRTRIKAGFLPGTTYPDAGAAGEALPVAQVALWNEKGTLHAREDGTVAGSPPRPFMQTTSDQARAGWKRMYGKLLPKVGHAKACEYIGMRMKEDIQHTINSWPRDNAPLTVERKGFNKGLIDTGFMLQNVDYGVEDV